MNVSLDQALLGRDKSHIHVVDMTSFQTIHDPWPASKFKRQEEAYTFYS